MLIELLEKIFPTLNDRNSRQEVKNRLKLILAHDRSDLTPQMIESMRQEILAVMSKYVDLDSDAMDFTLENRSRVTSLVANLPILRVKPEFYTVKGEGISQETPIEDLPEISIDESAIGDFQGTSELRNENFK
ncbi:MAG: cell division topological specificity factor MinE [Alkalinema sp. CAN_BIN05]|nr:cell division topological specificity factor MinE [Alkalinema sp. CAN_BIN05]